MMKKAIIFGMALTLSTASIAGFKLFTPKIKDDLNRLARVKKHKSKIIDRALKSLNEKDREMKLACIPDYRDSFSAVKTTLEASGQMNKEFLLGSIQLIVDGLKDNSTKLENAKKQRRKDKRAYRKSWTKEINKLTDIIKEDAKSLVEDSLVNDSIQNLLSGAGNFNIAMKEDIKKNEVTTIFKEQHQEAVVSNPPTPAASYNQSFYNFFDSCKTSLCVDLLATDIKMFLKKMSKINGDIKVIDGLKIKGLKLYSTKKINKKIDELAAAASKNKGIADLSACLELKVKPKQDEVDPSIVDVPANVETEVLEEEYLEEEYLENEGTYPVDADDASDQ
jgi:hypothetical protein